MATPRPADPAPLHGRFAYPRTAEVVYGPGSLAELGGLAERIGAARVFAIVSATLAREGLEDELRAALGDRLAGVFSGVRQHVPRESVIEAATAAREAGAD